MEGPSDESLDYIAPIVTNVTRQKAGRMLLLDPSRGFLRALTSQLRSTSVMRRRGCAAALRNVCYGAQVCSASAIALNTLKVIYMRGGRRPSWCGPTTSNSEW